MNKTKSIVTGFAIFAAFLMLMATCIAGPVREKTSIDAVENEQQELLNSVEALCLKIENDQELVDLIEQISLEKKQEFTDLQSYFENSYSSDMQNINDEIINLLETLVENSDADAESEDLVIGGFLSLGDVIPVGLPDINPGLAEGAQDLTISSSGDIVLMWEELDPIDSDSSYDFGSGEAQYGGFAFNIDGGMLVPGYGWVYPDDPNWDDLYDLHNSLQGLPMSSATAVLDIVAEMIGPETTGIISLLVQIIIEIFGFIIVTIAEIVDAFFVLLVGFGAFIVSAIGTLIVAAFQFGYWLYQSAVILLQMILDWLRGIIPY